MLPDAAAQIYVQDIRVHPAAIGIEEVMECGSEGVWELEVMECVIDRLMEWKCYDE